MRKLFILFIIFSTQAISADSLSSSVNSQLPNYYNSLGVKPLGDVIRLLQGQLPNNLITNIGLKPSDLTLADAWEGSSAESSEGEKPSVTNEKYWGCCIGGSCTFGILNIRLKKIKNSWIITEPLGGLVTGYIGGLAGVGFALCLWKGDDAEKYGTMPVMLFYSIGVGPGIWSTSNLVEEEKGSLASAMWGSILGGLGAIGIYSMNINETVSTGAAIVLPITVSLISYRLTLKK